MLTENEARFIWKEEHQDSFELKQALISSSILAFPKIEGEYILDIDASNQRIEAEYLITETKRQKKLLHILVQS